MKNKIDFRSFQTKVWLYVMLFTVILLGLIWFMQIFFLNIGYESMKIAETENIVNDITKTYQNDSFEQVTDMVSKITVSDDTYISIVSNKGNLFTPSTALEAYQGEIETIDEELKNSKKGTASVSMTLVSKVTQRKTWVYLGYLDAAHDVKLYVVSPLHPVSSTINILTDQLTIVVIIALILAMLFSLLLSSKVSNPIRRITKSARRLAQGEFGIIFPSSNKFSELDDLSRTLNKTSLELERSSILQKDLMANVSHDLKTPLTMVKSYAEMIRDLSGDNPTKRNEHLQVIIDESDRLNILVNDVLQLSKMQSEEIELQLKAFSIKALIENSLHPYSILEITEGYSIQFNCRNDILVVGDPNRIKQVMTNLISNAIKYCGSDKRIFINAKHWGNKMHIEVVDLGNGIKPEELPYVWERYYKSSTHHVRKAPGTGLGLSIVKQILIAHNSRFGVESKVEKGTTFWFELDAYVPSKTSSKSKGLLNNEKREKRIFSKINRKSEIENLNSPNK